MERHDRTSKVEATVFRVPVEGFWALVVLEFAVEGTTPVRHTVRSVRRHNC